MSSGDGNVTIEVEEREALIEVLQDIQEEHNYLPKDELLRLSKKLDVPLSKIFSLASFFGFFSLTPRGKHIVQVCSGTACHVRGGIRILRRFEQELGVKSGETTEDMQFTLQDVSCFGYCSLPPTVKIDEKIFSRMLSNKVPALLRKYRYKGD